MENNSVRAEHLFVVRVRAEAGHWRGYVLHVPSGRHLYFADLADLIDFIELRSEPGGWRRPSLKR